MSDETFCWVVENGRWAKKRFSEDELREMRDHFERRAESEDLTVRWTGAAQASESPTFRDRVHKVLSGLEDLLVAKNEAYGNSALDPVNIFSKSTAVEQIKVRIDDKLSRLYHGKEYGDEDTITDLMGYLILLRIAEREAEENK